MRQTKRLTTLATLFLLGLGILLNAQSYRPADLVKEAKTTKQEFNKVSLFTIAGRSTSNLPKEIKDYTTLTLNRTAIKNLLSDKKGTMDLTIPRGQRQNLDLELVEVKLMPFNIIESPANKKVKYQNGRHYRGIVKGQPKSVVAISVFEDEVMGFISEERSKGNLVIGKMGGRSSEHIIYEDKDLLSKFNFDCQTEDTGTPYEAHEVYNNSGVRALTDCVGMYFEVDYDIYLDKGSNTNNVSNYITGLFNQVSTLYANENILTNISEINIWTTTSPYNGATSSDMLNQFTAYRNGFNGNIAMLLSYQASGGIAYVNTLCSNVSDYRMGFSSIYSTYSNAPTYSWSVEVITHEFGHLLGSQHTHACVWNGDNTAIDGCYTTEGGCSNPGLPSGGGTIMSYCHLTSAGINFNNGFGTQPGNLIRNKVTNATCLSSCPGAPSCTDGIQNGEETGVDCGGPNCSPCNSECTDNSGLLTIVLDNYPGETTWDVKNASGTVLYSGGPYSVIGETILVPMCLVNGCYDFTIYDEYGDGICCSYGNGSYNLVVGGNNVASGGQFASSQAHNFCLSGAPTCNDGIQNGDETGVDCGGSCGACPTCNDGIQNGDETGVDCGGSCGACATCNDGIQNGDETGIDCGGSCGACATCNDGIQNGDETGIDCGGSCGACATCNDGIQNGDETGIDCGGSCGACATCNDGIQNGDETGIDCGGSCGACATCNDGIQNGDETGIDCGGSCGACATCNDGIQNGDETGIDCGGNCGACATCNDGIQNGDETGIDCGGSCGACATCNDSIQNGDETGIDCGGSCGACATCNDGIQNGDETGIDCGGSCGYPAVAITGDLILCIEYNTTLSPATGGVWTSSDDNIATVDTEGIVTTWNQGFATFTFTNDQGCSSLPTESIYVNGYPSASISGPSNICVGGTTTLSPSTGGYWYAGISAVASVNASGEVTGLMVGSTAFKFVEDATGCTSEATEPVTVNEAPVLTYDGPSSICIGSTTSVSSSIGGAWSSNDGGIATVTAEGVVTAISDGVATLSFTTNQGCSSNLLIYVGNPYSSCPTCEDGIQNGTETGVDCGGSCGACPTCNDGIQNGTETGIDCGGTCGACPTCEDGIQNGTETGVDCGGSCGACPTCNDGIQNGTETGVDCGGSCGACPTCEDGIQNGTETGVDCGGSCGACPTCEDGIQNGTETGVDCGGSCGACPTCEDGIQNGTETGVDCGGSCGACPTCEDGIQNGTETGVDCGGSCGACPTCEDGIQNGTETGVDCGGSCGACPTCEDGIQNGTETGIDCGGTCGACPTCNDGIQNGTETGVDCGGSCGACPTCEDGIQNGTETGVDCGGSCGACPTCEDGIQNGTETGIDCGGTCGACPTCEDGIQNGTETGVDCGGSCGACPTCEDGIQNGTETGVDCGGSCGACPTCEDGIQNGTETGVDCGGSCGACPTCNDGIQNGTETGVDCGGSCGACPTCEDGIQNGTETGVDCGGTCGACPTCEDGIQNGTETGVDCGGSCGACPTCEDGIQNGTETGVDCGGSCGACPTCEDGIQNGDETGIDCGGSCGACPTCEDGIQNGDETGIDCGGSCGACATCEDGIQNGDETGVDCGGSCGSCSILLGGYYFESGWDGWTDGGTDCARYTGPRSYEGSYSIYIRDNTSTSVTTSPVYNLTNYSSIAVQFHYYPTSMESGEDFWLQYYNGSTWQTVATYVSGSTFTNNSFNSSTVVINSNQHNFGSNARLRFRNDASDDTDLIYLDAITIMATPNGPSCNDGSQNGNETGVDCGGSCAPCPTCNDGIQNGDETGVDCGGICVACPTCDDGIQNGDETGIDCGGICGIPNASINGETSICQGSTTTLSPTTGGTWVSSNASIATVTNGGIVTGVSAGIVTFTFTSTSGCVSNSTGEITVNGVSNVSITGETSLCQGSTTTLSPTTGGTWVSSNASIATVTNGGIVTGVSAGIVTFTYTSTAGCESSPTEPITITECSSSTVLGAYYFETGWQGWSDGGTDCARYSGPRSYEGSYSISIRDNTTTSIMTSPTHNVTAYTKLTIDFWFYSTSMDTGEDFWLQYYNGTTWSTVGSYIVGVDFANNAFTNKVVTLLNTNYAFPSNAKFRFVNDASADDDIIYIDQVIITGYTGNNLNEVPPPSSLISEARQALVPDVFTIYPNPTIDFINIDYKIAENGKANSKIKLRLFDITGKKVSEEIYENTNSTITHPISNMKTGIYLLQLSNIEGKVLYSGKVQIVN